ncbi:PAS domain-containing protein [Sulfurimonas sp. HSL-1716]|uniref:PAS domain-containing protein n=1 Tax=Hydrocurvibacter sulfurireducens TaxID=3131937 RepID=UPI0031F7F4E6
MKELNFDKNEIIVSKTDTKGKITYGNELFLKLAGYSEKELLGAPHNIIRHPDMPKIVFKLLWDTVHKGKEVYAYVVNKAKNGDYYWVFANVTPSYDAAGKIIGYHSVRRKPSKKAVDIVKPLYRQLLDAEKTGGMSASEKMLNDLLAKNGGRYDKFILSL